MDFALLLSSCSQDVWEQKLGHAPNYVGDLIPGCVSLQGSFSCSTEQGSAIILSTCNLVNLPSWTADFADKWEPSSADCWYPFLFSRVLTHCLTEEIESQKTGRAEQGSAVELELEENQEAMKCKECFSRQPGSSAFAAEEWVHSWILRECSASVLTQASLTHSLLLPKIY